MSFRGCDDINNVMSDTEICSIAITYESCELTDVTPIMVDGIKLGDSKSKVIDTLGDIDATERRNLHYRDKNDLSKSFLFFFDDDILIETFFII